MSTSPQMNSRCFTCTLLDEDADIGERLTVLTLRRVRFAHTNPIILTASELQELRHLLNQWPENGPANKKGGGP